MSRLSSEPLINKTEVVAFMAGDIPDASLRMEGTIVPVESTLKYLGFSSWIEDLSGPLPPPPPEDSEYGQCFE